MARRRDHSEGAAGERLDHQEEQRLQRGAPETQVIQTHQYFNNQKKKNRACFGWLLKQSFAVFCMLQILQTSFSPQKAFAAKP